MTYGSSPPSRERLPDIDTTKAHTARVWNYWLASKASDIDVDVSDPDPILREAGRTLDFTQRAVGRDGRHGGVQ